MSSTLVISAHAADFVWRAGGAIALAAARGEAVTVVCLSFGERGESASAWRAGKTLEEIKALRRGEAESAAAALGAGIEFLDAGDYPLRESDELVDRLVRVYREVSPSVVLTHPLADPYNGDHPAAGQMALRLEAGQAMGLGDVREATIPKVSLIAPPADGGTVCTRTFIPVLGAVSVATALLLDGAVGHDPGVTGPRIDIEHPGGHLLAEVELDPRSQPPRVLRAGVVRTARKLFDGAVFPRRLP